MDVIGVAFLALLIGQFTFWIVAMVDAAWQPWECWAHTGRRKSRWSFSMIVVGLGTTGGVVSLGYWLLVRPGLIKARRDGVAAEDRPLRREHTPRRRKDWADPWREP